MASKITKILKERKAGDGVAVRIENYERHCNGASPELETDDQTPYIAYYDLVTDLFEYGWGQSFHFAPRASKESFAASLARHEHYLAHRLGLGPGITAIDLGCGVGGPLIEIARFSGARITGVNINAMQLERAERRCKAEGLGHLADWLHCDFMNVDVPDACFDTAYSIEATVHAADKVAIYAEAFRLLKPGGSLAVYEYCMTDRFNPDDPVHQQLKAEIEYGGALPSIALTQEVDDVMRKVGFDLMEARDLASDAPPGIPWYQPLAGSGLSFARVRSSVVGRRLTSGLLWLLERLKVVPRGTTQVASLLNLCAAGLAEAGRLGIFTPMYFVLVRKPE